MCGITTANIVLCGAVLTGSPGSADPLLEAFIQEKLKGISREASDRNDKYRKCKQLLMVSKSFYYIYKRKNKQKSPAARSIARLHMVPVCSTGGERSQLHVCR